MKKLHTASFRLWLPVFVVMTFTLLLTTYSLWRSGQGAQLAEHNAMAQVEILMSAERYRLEQLLRLNEPAVVIEEMAQVGATTDVDFFVLVDNKTQVLYSSKSLPVGQLFNSGKTGFDDAKIRMVAHDNRPILEFNDLKDVLLAYQPITLPANSDTSRQDSVGILLLRYNIKQAKAQIRQSILTDFLIYFGFTLVVTFGLVLLVYRWFTQPLITLQQAVHRISKGDFTEKINLTGHGELAKLGKSIEHMQQARQQTERTLRETEQYFQDTFRFMPAALALHSEQGIFVDCSDAFCDATGYSREETIGQHALDLKLWAKPEQRVAMRATLERDGQVEGIEYQLRHRNGHTTMMEMSARYLTIGGERLLLSVAHDIAERKNAEAALYDSENRFKDTFRLMPAALALHSEQGVFLDCSEVFCRATGYSREEMVGRNAVELHLWAQLEQRATMRATLLRDGQVDGFEYQLRHRSGTITMMQMSARHLLIGGQRLLLSFAHDISARKKADADLLIALNEKTALLNAVQKSETILREAKLAAEIANKSKSEFLASMSHEIRTPINGVLGLTQLLFETPLNVEQKEFVKTILTSGNALMAILNDILDLSKMEAGKMEIEFIPYKPRQLVRDVVDAMSVLASQKKIRLTLVCAEAIPLIASSDPTRIRQILFNLIGNAVKFTQEGSVNVSLSIEQQKLRFEIKDTGVGIAAEKQPLLFQMFTQENASTSRTFGGSGLGLAITKQLVRLMGGDIGFESEKNVGSLFWVNLPLGQIEESFALMDENTKGQLQYKRTVNEFSGCRVLLVDDNGVNLMVAGGMLKNLGLPFDVAHSGQEAIEKVFARSYNLVLMDCEMPEQDGYDTTRVIRHREQTTDNAQVPIPIVALTANAMSEDRQRCMDCGMNGFIAKPLKMDELHSIMSEYIFSHPKADRRKNSK